LLWQKKSIVLQQRLPKAQVWAIDEVITSTLNPVVLACVMNYSKGHWLLLDALTTIITHGHGSYATTTSSNKFEIFDPFDVEIFFLHNNMWLDVIRIIKPLMEFLKSFDAQYVHNMMTIMLDPHFKVSHIMEYLVGSGNVI
jgi:hypothetical protein